MNDSALLSLRVNCPCCRYPTLTRRNDYDICELCNWEDSGHDDPYADDICGGPNGDYSLTEARANFKRYRCMYRLGSYAQTHHPDSGLAYQTKGLLMNAFERLQASKEFDEELESEIIRLEKILEDEVIRRLQEHELKNAGKSTS